MFDVDAPLLGPRGAAAVFGPQKGASAEQIVQLEAGPVRGWRPDRSGPRGGTGDIVITGEGRYDETSTFGKASGYVPSLAGPRQTVVIAGSVAEELRGDGVYSLTEIAGSTTAARNDPARWAAVTAERAARRA